MEKDEIGAGKGGMKDYWEFTSDVLDFLAGYLEERRSELSEGLGEIAEEDPYLMGFKNGFESGFKVAYDLTLIASAKASVGEYMLTTEERRELATRTE